MPFFYDHIILIHHVHQEIEAMLVSPEAKEEVIELIEETIHYHIIKRILDRLDQSHHEDFLIQLHDAPHHRELLKYLKQHIPDIEFHIKEAADEIKYELLKTIREA